MNSRIDPMALADRSWPLLKRVMQGHVLVYRLSGGLIGHRFLGSPPTLLLDHVGAKSGTKRTTPVFYVDDPPNVVVVASKGGYPRNPGVVPQPPGQPGHRGSDRLTAPARPCPRRHRCRTRAAVAEGGGDLLGLCRLSAPHGARDPAGDPRATRRGVTIRRGDVGRKAPMACFSSQTSPTRDI